MGSDHKLISKRDFLEAKLMIEGEIINSDATILVQSYFNQKDWGKYLSETGFGGQLNNDQIEDVNNTIAELYSAFQKSTLNLLKK